MKTAKLYSVRFFDKTNLTYSACRCSKQITEASHVPSSSVLNSVDKQQLLRPSNILSKSSANLICVLTPTTHTLVAVMGLPKLMDPPHSLQHGGFYPTVFELSVKVLVQRQKTKVPTWPSDQWGKPQLVGAPQLSGFVCPFNLVVQGSNPKYLCFFHLWFIVQYL